MGGNIMSRNKTPSASDINIATLAYDAISEIMALELFSADPEAEAYNNGLQVCIDIINRHKTLLMDNPKTDFSHVGFSDDS